MKTFGNFLLNLLKENPVFGLYLGLCSVLAVTTSLDNAVGMGVSVIIVLTISNIMISSIRKITPNEIRIPVYIVVIATLTKSIELLIKAYAPAIDVALGVFIPLIVVNCIILGRAEAFASTNKPVSAIVDGAGMALGYTFALLLISLVRELLGNGTLTIWGDLSLNLRFLFDFLKITPIDMFTKPVGAFLTFGFILAAITALSNTKQAKLKKAVK